MGKPLMKNWVSPDGTEYEVCDEVARQQNGGNGTVTNVSDCYKTEREENDLNTYNVNSTVIFGLFDALMESHSDCVTKKEVYNDDGTFVNYEYIFSVKQYNEGEYNADGTGGVRFQPVADIKKPKYLIMCAIHGRERHTPFATYRFFRDLVEGKNIPNQFREGAVVHVMPVVNRYGMDHTDSSGKISAIRANANGVDLNRNFDYKWGEDQQADRYPGDYAESENETQVVVNWLKANTDATLFIDYHNSSVNKYQEIVAVIGLPGDEKIKQAKRTALQGVYKVVPFWREELGEKVAYAYASDYDVPGASVFYAASKLGITSLTLECSSRQDDPTKEFTPVTIAVSAEALGNILLQFNEQTDETNYAEKGQFAVSDGKGGIAWMTAFSAEEVGY